MNLLFILAHPRKASFSHQIASRLIDESKQLGCQVRLRDLYAENFDPVLRMPKMSNTFEGLDADVQSHLRDLFWAEVVIFIYPIWWWERPAILKGWFDRVFVSSIAFVVGRCGVEGKLSGKRALCIQTLGGGQEEYESGLGRIAIEATIGAGSLECCGFDEVEYLQCYGMMNMNHDRAEAIMDRAKEALERVL